MHSFGIFLWVQMNMHLEGQTYLQTWPPKHPSWEINPCTDLTLLFKYGCPVKNAIAPPKYLYSYDFPTCNSRNNLSSSFRFCICASTVLCSFDCPVVGSTFPTVSCLCLCSCITCC